MASQWLDISAPIHSVFDPKNGRGVFAFLWPNQGTYRRSIIGTYWLALTQGFQWYQKDVCRCFSLVTMKRAPHKYYTGSLIVNWYTVGWGGSKFPFWVYFLHLEKIIQMALNWANGNQSEIWFCQIKIQEFCHLTLDYQFFIWIWLLVIK